MNLERYLFIDGGHLRRYFRESLRAWSGVEPELVIDEVKRAFDAGKCFFYDAIDDERRPDEDDIALRDRLAVDDAWFEKVQRTYATHVRLGSVTGRQKNRRQKQVDILLAVEMMNHAVRKNMRWAVLLSGDQDFKPLVDSLVQMGLYVDVVGDKRHTSSELARSADSYQPLAFSDYHKWALPEWRNAYPLPQFGYDEMNTAAYDRAGATGTLSGAPVEVYLRERDFLVYWRHPDHPAYAYDRDMKRAMLAAKLEFGPIDWT